MLIEDIDMVRELDRHINVAQGMLAPTSLERQSATGAGAIYYSPRYGVEQISRT